MTLLWLRGCKLTRPITNGLQGSAQASLAAATASRLFNSALHSISLTQIDRETYQG